MKQVTSGIVLLAMAFVMASCGNGIKGDKVESGEAQAEQIIKGEKTLKADLTASNIAWTGSKPTGKHNGTIMLKEGNLELSEGNLVGGSFTIDISSIKVLDLTDAKMNGDLRGHLLSADFFHVDSFPTSTFVITGVEALNEAGATHRITGNLTMKGISRSISFPASVKIEEQKLTATSSAFVINRAEWNIRYGSRSFFKNLKDNFINDEIGLKINLTATL
ncbi:MAG TPA: YceI family protein [Bacteroidales bacterium]|nr:YceI family protein [Bacteroidales bacterium]HRZ47827.1 YceI family protein [Bacteroidales bacterium]